MVRTKKGFPDADSASGGSSDPLAVMIRAYLVTCLMGCVGFAILCRYSTELYTHNVTRFTNFLRVFLHSSARPNAWMYYSVCGAVGMACAFLFVLITQYYTDYEYCKVIASAFFLRSLDSRFFSLNSRPRVRSVALPRPPSQGLLPILLLVSLWAWSLLPFLFCSFLRAYCRRTIVVSEKNMEYRETMKRCRNPEQFECVKTSPVSVSLFSI